ncbi:DUF2306 domain-containing protein [Spirosoma foliorum]|uniref:DUF2306 domain-containing protein n=1 Tax=Spirosoma foliorum TaxID=2710596 RepID=A0A7G5GNW8_9BACT|nr:DUF2306 domain-containing protein [Spirosoma foliorum]QMW00560.1 DUF2306 domain-containing protein [Spirosoma foliorum]
MIPLSTQPVTKKRVLLRLSTLCITFLALLIALYAVTYLLGFPFQLNSIVNARPLDFLAVKGTLAHQLLWKTAFTIHLVGGSLGLVLGAFLFFSGLYQATTHRFLGTIYTMAILCSSVAGLYLSYYASVSPMGIFGFFLTDIGWFGCTWLGVRAVSQNELLSHKRWFLRSYAFTLIVVSFRILFQLFFNGFHWNFDIAYVTSIWLSLGLNSSIGELIIWKTYRYEDSAPTNFSRSR